MAGYIPPFPVTFWTTIAQRPQEALARISRLYREPILEYVRRRAPQDADAEDIVQEVMAELCEPGFLLKADREKGRFRSFLLGVTNHKILHARDKERRRKASSLEQGGLEGERLDLSAASSEDEVFNELWEAKILKLARERLQKEERPGQPRYYQAHVLQHLQHLSQKECAEKLGVSVDTVNNWVHVAKTKIIEYARELAQEYSSTEDEFREEVRRLLRRMDPEQPPA